MRFVLGCLIIACATPAIAQKALHVQALLGFDGKAEYDKVEVDGQTLDRNGSDTLEGNFGLQVTYDQPAADQWRIGGRLAFMTSETDDTNDVVTTVDAGLWVRYVFSKGDIKPFAAAGAGLTWVSFAPDEDGVPFEVDSLTGFGWHIMGGLGVEVPAGGSAFTAGLYLSRQEADVEGEVTAGALSADATYEDGLVSRFLLAVGMGF